jgi:prevent-host-death family protein
MKQPSKSRSARKALSAVNEWQLQDAKAKFSEVFRLARERGPQRVTKHGRTAVVVLPAEDYERLAACAERKGGLVEFFAESPLAGYRIRIERQRDFGRTVEL